VSGSNSAREENVSPSSPRTSLQIPLSGEIKMVKYILIRVPEKTLPELRKAKGDETWLTLLLDGAKYRGSILNAPPPLLEDKEALKLNDIIKQALAYHPNFLEVFHRLGRSSQALEVYECLLWAEEPVTPYDIADSKPSISEASIYRCIKTLKELGLITCVGYRRMPYTVRRGGGSIPSLWVAV